jgi:hypothetical protein
VFPAAPPHSRTALDDAIAGFAIAYADQSTADYELFTSAVKKGRLAIAKAVD